MIRKFLNICALLMLCALILPQSAFAENSRNFAAKQPAQKVEERAASAGGGNAARAWLSYYKGEQKNVNYRTLMKFIGNHPDFPAMDRLRAEAEKAMPSDLSEEEVLEWFLKNPPQTVFGMRIYAEALRGRGQNEMARQQINDWWKTVSLTPAEQSKGFMAFASYLDKSSHEARLRRLIHRDQYTNARSVAEALGPAYVALTEARIALRANKGNVNALLNRVPQSLQDDEGLLFDRLQFRRKGGNNEGAIEILNKSPPQDAMHDADGWGKERSIIARRLFEEGKYAQAYRLSANSRLTKGSGFATNEWMAGWLALEYLKKPWQAFEHFEKLYQSSETPISKSRATYWAGLASEHLNHPEIAVKWYNAGAAYPTTFYGQLAAEKIQRPPNLRGAEKVSGSSMRNGSLATAARWLKKNGYKIEAGMFLNKMIELSSKPQDYAAVAEVADELSMKNFEIRAAQESEKKNGFPLVGHAFPRIEKYMSGADVEWALVHALVRQESRYDMEAVSSAGARGLMQLMPGTAKEVAQKAGLSHQNEWLTTRPGHNVALGSRYLKQLLDRYDGNYAMALAAYNAGPSRVTRWVAEFGDPRSPDVDLVNWIEMIPIYETRNYVQRVLEGVYVYRQTLSNNKGQRSGGMHMASQ
ncbi:MAG: transglycosylase [Micavibrio aeruginosavorus]|uniref:Transglycosylase n=1 Tax=Micavibrio aeruginosavorus TaxID=349221 RepID=A0A2W5BXN2_9BACT|nr:MAG: transglycosylase [Micavibrio aeruginosavorus]